MIGSNYYTDSIPHDWVVLPNSPLEKYDGLQENSLPHPCHHHPVRPSVTMQEQNLVEEQKNLIDHHRKKNGNMFGVEIPNQKPT